jgi:hypothetical protein
VIVISCKDYKLLFLINTVVYLLQNLKHHGFELKDNSWHKPEKCARVCETTHLHGRMCCLSNLKFQNSFGQDNNDKTLHGELVHKFQCGTHNEVCKFPVRCVSSCLVCSRERLSTCCTCDSEKPSCIRLFLFQIYCSCVLVQV